MSQTKIDISNLSDAVIAALSVPKITSITYPGDDTAANPTGGQEIILTGSGFGTGAIVHVAGVPVSVSSVVNNNTLSFTSPAKSTGTYSLAVINTDGGIATSISNIEYSGVPAWSTPAGTLGTLYEASSINAQLTATSDSTVTYAVTAGVLPTGGSLNSSTGALTGTASLVGSSTTYSFTIDAVDAEQQDTSRNFSYTINPDTVTWNSPAEGATLTGTQDTAFSQELSATSAAGRTISYSANALPSGLSISGSTITGTPTVGYSSSSLLTATAATTGRTATRTFVWNIASLAPTYTITPASSSVNEGSALTFNVGGTNITNGTYYWSINNISTAAGDFSGSVTSGSFTITSNAGSFNVTATADVTTEGAQTFTVSLRTGSVSGTIVATSSTVTINDTSITNIATFGTLWNTGRNDDGMLGVGTNTNKSYPVQIGTLTTWESMSSADFSFSAIKTDGTLWSWGFHSYGSLGLGDTIMRSVPTQVGALTNWKSAYIGRSGTVHAIKTNGTFWTWGNSQRGVLGTNVADGASNSRSSPVQVGTLTNWAMAGGGQYMGCAVKTDGTLWTWGQNYSGELGLGNTIGCSSPIQVGALTNWQSVFAESAITLAIKTNGTIWSWGRGGALGLNDTTYRSSPTQIGTLATWAMVHTRSGTSMAIKTDGTLWSWGFNSNGVHGQNDINVVRSSPTQVGTLTNWRIVNVGSNHAAAIKTDGTLWSWGRNNNGQLGLGDILNRSSPVQIGTLTNWIKTAAGQYSIMAIKS